ncbi:hypothetical protein COLAER_00962 [Collinsella aerofaciens ATCC 25986]|uniref:IstB-like ATP-binding domain-containing protein n=1 Tax=Collinsella aerofaciens (strain ATCC 25986 / DSM 3979 / JCM 10188 / KCTC 3647 / NCTC 11838 / VPI 1003) TaxID=411903 RepID=A4E970_COLAA|nr:hypothetical protein COLAER_00962 [Collinsella aerofaciens ATCC 25986]
MTRVEVAAREVRITSQRIRSSGFPYVKGLADFDWDFQPSVPRAEIEELATLRFVERAENVLFVGEPPAWARRTSPSRWASRRSGRGARSGSWTAPGSSRTWRTPRRAASSRRGSSTTPTRGC